MKLRPYQTEAVEKVYDAFDRGMRSVLVCAPTGAGKTTIAAELARIENGKHNTVFFVAHRRELIKQAFCRLTMGLLDPRHVGVIAGGVSKAAKLDLFAASDDAELHWKTYATKRPNAIVQVCSVESLRSLLALQGGPQNSLQDARRMKHPDLVIIDEAHRSAANGYRRLFETWNFARFVGITATPIRNDGKGLSDVFDELVQTVFPHELVEQGYLAKPRIIAPRFGGKELEGVRTKLGDYDDKQTDEIMRDKKMISGAVETWMQFAGNRKTVAFAVSVNHSKELCAEFNERGVRAAHIDGTTPTAKRDGVLADLRAGRLDVVCNANILTEGWDDPSVRCALLCRPTKSLTVYLQQCGRVLRPHPSGEPIIIDHAWCLDTHDTPIRKRIYTLQDSKKKRDAAPRIKICQGCFSAISPSQRVCPHCGHESQGPEVTETSREDVEFEVVDRRADIAPEDERFANSTEEERRAKYNELLGLAQRRGNSNGWAAHRYREEYGQWPPRAWEPIDKSPEAMRREHARLASVAQAKGFKPGWVYHQFKAKFGVAPDAIPAAQPVHYASDSGDDWGTPASSTNDFGGGF